MNESGPIELEASGETVGEARWAALHELERRYPGLDRSAVEFTVLSEGERGLLGVGYEPARVLARLAAAPDPAAAPDREPAAPHQPSQPRPGESEPAMLVRSMVDAVVHGLELVADVAVSEREGEISAVVHGDDLGLLIGKHGQTIDAVQYLCNAALHRRFGRGVEAVVDAEGYRVRRERVLGEVAAQAAAEARHGDRPVALDPMTAAERKIVHTKVQAMAGVTTSSEGVEPNRYVVVSPDRST